MKTRVLVPIFAVCLSTFSASVAYSQETRPLREFYCGTSDGEPATIVRIPEKNKEFALIQWMREIPGMTRQERCEIVSNRFQQYYDQGILRYMKGARMNRQPVVCVAENETSMDCAGLLWTLEPRDNPTSAIQRLRIVSTHVRNPLSESPTVYVDMRELLELP